MAETDEPPLSPGNALQELGRIVSGVFPGTFEVTTIYSDPDNDLRPVVHELCLYPDPDRVSGLEVQTCIHFQSPEVYALLDEIANFFKTGEIAPSVSYRPLMNPKLADDLRDLKKQVKTS